MRILRVAIKNFRGFRDQTILLGGHTAFVGENNSGKSTIIDAVRRPLDPDPPLQDVTETDFPDADFRAHRISIEVVIGDLEQAAAPLMDHWEAWDVAKDDLVPPADDPGVFDTAGIEKVVRFGYRAWWDDEEERIKEQRYYPGFSPDDDWDKAQHARVSDRRRIPFYSVPFPRDARRLLDLTRRSPLSRLLTARKVTVQSEVREVRQKLRDMGPVLAQNEGFAQVLNDIAEILGAFMPLKSGAPLALQPLAEGEADLLRAFQAVVHLHGDSAALPLASHGGGMRNVAAAAALLCLAATNEKFILAFEEPEVSLHPALQRYFVSKLRERSAQLLVSTHSTEVASRFPLNELRLVRAEGGRTVIAPSISTPGERRHAVHWSSKVGPALFTRTSVLVEGMTDEVAFRAFAEIEHRAGRITWDFDALNWSVVSFDGNSGTALAGTMKGFGLRVFAIIDGDADGDKYKTELTALGVSGIQLPKGFELEDLITCQASPTTLATFAELAAALGYTDLEELVAAKADIDGLRDRAKGLLKQSTKNKGDAALVRAIAAAYESDGAPSAIVELLQRLRSGGTGFHQLIIS